ncbi:pex8p [Saccharomyces arboricola H-6]|uniref:Pex8p n=1 Tax=Saccharomyces arboricola (strain H-6 / AS 2.3317 / CBS 10644) TaxID=1160507 RepID=J8Q1Y3_SACAR|nr:pex8p [Saccharomyces arboricola H-6]
MSDSEVEYLITALSSTSRIQYDQRLLDEVSANLVYYVPRIKCPDTLYRLLRALFQSQLIVQLPPLRLLHGIKDIFLRKLEVSEPTLPVSKFYQVWDAVLTSHRAAWSLSQLMVLGGILVTYPRFKSLNDTYFIDESNSITALYYRNWKLSLFFPIWAQFWNDPAIKANQSIQNYLLVSMFLLFNRSDMHLPSHGANIPWDLVAGKLLGILAEYTHAIRQPVERFTVNSVLSTNLNHLANCLNTLFTRSSEPTLLNSLHKLEKICQYLSFTLRSSHQEQQLDLKFQDLFILIILALKEILSMNMKISANHKEDFYFMICSSLFFIHVLTEKIGTVGFPSYHYVYDNLITYYITLNDLSKIIPILNHMKMNGINKDQNKLIFYINFLNKVTNYYSWRIRLPFITEFIEPLLHFKIFLEGGMSNSLEIEIKESIHTLAITSLTIDPSYSSDIAQWQVSRIIDYLRMSMDQFTASRLSAGQILIIFSNLSTQFPSLHIHNKHLLRDSLHETYTRILNTKKLEKKEVLIECLIVQIPFVNDPHHLIHWLNMCFQLINAHHKRLLQQLWEMVSSLGSPLAIDWWYTTVIPLQSSKL